MVAERVTAVRDAGARPGRGADPGLLAIGFLLLAAACTALTVDVARTAYGVKGDEATYVAMALSVAYDGDLVYEPRDIARLHEVYEGGPSGIFLKRVGVRDRDDRLYFGKAYIYSVVAAPFVRIAGLNGMLLFNVVLLAGMVLAAYCFLAARAPRDVAFFSALAFFGVSIVPLHAVFLGSEIFNAACVTFAYFCWCHKEVAPPRRDRWTAWLWRPESDLVAAVLLGLATFSKPSHALLIGPCVLLAAGRWRLRHSARIAVVFVVVVATAFAINAVVSGELNYQGGDRKIFYGEYPFEHPGAAFDNRGTSMTTNDVDEEAWRVGFLSLMPRNLGYFLVGRHFGLLPFFFPGVVAIALFLTVRRERRPWQWSVLGVVALSVVVLSGTMPYTWSGGGGPAGNRYFLSIYPVLLFLMPPPASFLPAIVAWAGGAAFTAHILVNPFVAAKQPYLSPERGLLRALPVELTMVDDLPIALDPSRHRMTYGSDPELLLSMLDRNVHRAGALDLWVAGSSRADIALRSGYCLSSMEVVLRSPVANRVTVRFGGDEATTDLRPGVEVRVVLEPSGVFVRGLWSYLLSVRTSAGFIPSLLAPGSRDERFLGAIIALRPHVERECAAG